MLHCLLAAFEVLALMPAMAFEFGHDGQDLDAFFFGNPGGSGLNHPSCIGYLSQGTALLSLLCLLSVG